MLVTKVTVEFEGGSTTEITPDPEHCTYELKQDIPDGWKVGDPLGDRTFSISGKIRDFSLMLCGGLLAWRKVK